MAIMREDRYTDFPEDVHWQNVLGVDLVRVESSMRDLEELVGWLARQSDALIARLEERAGMSALKGTKRERAARLVVSESGRVSVRHALLCRYYLVNRRKEALERTLDGVLATRPSLADLGSARGDWVRVALGIADAAPEFLLWFALWDRALRVGYREYRLAGARGEGLQEMAGGIHVDKSLVDRAIKNGFDGDTFRCVDVVPHPEVGAYLVFILHGVGRDRVRTLDGVRHLGRAQWIILRLTNKPHRLLFHSRGELGARLAEAILVEALGGGSFAYRPYRPQTEHLRVAAWAEELVRREGREIRLYEIDLLLDEAPQVTWKIQGEVRTGLALLARAVGAGTTPHLQEPDRAATEDTEASDGLDGLDGEDWEDGPNGPETAAASVIARRLIRVNLGFRESQDGRWSRFTLWVRPGGDEAWRIVTYQGHGVSPAERRAFVTWMQGQGVACAPA